VARLDRSLAFAGVTARTGYEGGGKLTASVAAGGRNDCRSQRQHGSEYETLYTSSMTIMTTIKVSAETRDRLKKLADADQSTMEVALAKVLDQAEEARFWQGVKDDYARLQDDPEQWADYVNELAEWDRTVSDGLDDLE
jgi:hypothetical protein